MIENELREYIRLIGSISFKQQKKDQIAANLIQKNANKKEISSKYVAAASAVAVVAISTFLIARGMRQDINIM